MGLTIANVGNLKELEVPNGVHIKRLKIRICFYKASAVEICHNYVTDKIQLQIF